MTNKNSPLKIDPFLLRPVGKDYLWGGSRLNDDFAKGIDLTPLAETWECSTHPDGPSVIASGPLAGQTLAEALAQHPDWLGSHPRTRGELPVLIKFIDARQDLSVQVHPTDAYAAAYENGQPGKSEMWYVLDAAPGASLVYGLRHDLDAAALRRHIAQGKLGQDLQRVPIQKGDVFYIEAGTIHAIGAGALIAEIQQSSNLTYRLYDYDRTDKQGNKRPLHVEKALAVANLHAQEAPRQPIRVHHYRPGCASELLCRCRYFQVEQLRILTDRCRAMVEVSAGENSFKVLLCVAGCGTAFLPQGGVLPFFKGDCLFMPANTQQMRLHGDARLLSVSC